MREVVLPVLDIGLLAYLAYKAYQILVQTRAIQLLKGAVVLGGLYAVAVFLNLSTVLWILNLLAPSLVVGLVVIFQPELRKIFTRIGQGRILRFSRQSPSYQLDAVLSAAEVLSYRRRGALIVFVRSVGQKNIIDTGTRLDADVGSALLISIFGHDTPLHDGAVVIEDGKIVAAGCFLPLSDQLDIRRSFGTRHRAALGLAEESDAVVLVVSEESGAISLAYEARLRYDLQAEGARRELQELLNVSSEREAGEEAATVEE
jgi:diadenylate cyclase